jgi:DNA-binding MarR family transcriptional regulator
VTATAPSSDVELASDLVVYAARLTRAVRRELELPAGTRIISLLDEHGPLGITQLAAVDRCSQPTMSAAVSQLAARGWVTKEPNPKDARGSVVTVTAAGRDELARVRRLNGERVAALVAADPAHTSGDLATAVAVLRDILATSNAEKGTS